MKRALRVEGEITEDGHLVVELPPELPRGRVVVTLEPLPESPLELAEEDLKGAGLTAEEIASSPEIGAWTEDRETESGAEYVEKIRRSRAVATVSEIQRRSVEQGTDTITPAEIDDEIAAVRRARP